MPISSGKRNWRSAVQKWLDAQQTALSANPPQISAPPSTSACTKVEHAPYWPRKGAPRARAAKLEAMIWLLRSPEIISCTSFMSRPAAWHVRSTARRIISPSANSQVFMPSRSSSSTTSNSSASGPLPSLGPTMLVRAAMAGALSKTKVCEPARLIAATPESHNR